MFHIEIQSPFTNEPILYPNCDINQAITLYEAIDWADLYKQMETTGDSPESPYYYYEITKANPIGEKEILCVSGYLHDKVGIEYTRPKLETRGFFRKKQVLNPGFQTQMIDMELTFAHSCVKAFLQGNSTYLEENLFDNEGF